MAKYINSINDHEVTDGSCLCWLGALLLGGIYYGIRGNWGWFFLYPLLVVSTFGLAFFVLPFFTRKINRAHLMRRGYREVK